ncbi:MAG: type VI secretion system-associated protein TagO [Maricaulis sp.]|nr:type VI secretion system-associated protein TagO [Maricaulis sp.]
MLLITLLVVLHFLPWMVALSRGHHNTMPIFFVNLFFGWTFVGWVVALIWSTTQVESRAGSNVISTYQSPENERDSRPEEIETNFEALTRQDRIYIIGAGLTAAAILVGFAVWPLIMTTPNRESATPSPERQEQFARIGACTRAISEARAFFELARSEAWASDSDTVLADYQGEVICLPLVGNFAEGGRHADFQVIASIEFRGDSILEHIVRIEALDGTVVATSEQLEAVRAEQRAGVRNFGSQSGGQPSTPNLGRQWRHSQRESQMTDFTNHFLSVDPVSDVVGRYGREIEVRLTVRCVEDTTALVVNGGEFLGTDTLAVEWRVGDASAFRDTLGISTNREAFGYWRGGSSIPFIRRLLSANPEHLTLRYTPYGENSRTVRFHVKDLGARIGPLREACSW